MKAGQFVQALWSRTDIARAADNYVVVGSGPLCIRGLRESDDVDLVASPNLYEEWKRDPLLRLTEEEISGKIPASKKLTGTIKGNFIAGVFKIEVFPEWNDLQKTRTFEILKARATRHPYMPELSPKFAFYFASLEDVREWKSAHGRAKDLSDVALIDTYRTLPHYLQD